MPSDRKKGPPAKYHVQPLPSPVEYYWGPVIDRQTARSLGLKRFFTGEPCLHGHIAQRWVASATCIECVKERHRTAEYKARFNPQEHESWSRNRDAYNAQRRAVKAARVVGSEARREASLRAWARRKAAGSA